MSDIVIEGNGISKKFKKGEVYDSLRDFVPALTGKIFGRLKNRELGDREFWALKDVTFHVERGKALGVIGSNGAGKSTLLKVLSGIIKPTCGEFLIRGRLSALIEVGAGFHPDLTGRENVFLNGAILGMSRQEITSKFDEIVHFSGLDDFIDTPVKRYSSGMYARLGFSVAAHINPDILLVDEVLSVGDWGFQKKCAEKMGQLMSGGVTIIFISHNLRAVTDLCDECMLLDRGRVVLTGPTDHVVKQYLDRRVEVKADGSKSSVRISDVRALKDGEEESAFSSGDKLVVQIAVTSQEARRDLALHVYLRDNNDYQVFHVYLELLGEYGFSLALGEVKVFNVELSLHLAAGAYYVGVMLVNEHDVSKIYDHKFPAAKLFVDAPEAIRCVANLYPRVVAPV